MILVGTAGWTIPKDARDSFPSAGTGLERYACVFTCVEINSSFYRSHRRATYERWAASVPDDFRFSLKVPKAITHGLRLERSDDLLEAFVDETSALGVKRGVLLVQLPPSLAFDERSASRFFALLRDLCRDSIACEPRHASWFDAPAEAMLCSFDVARVAADPAVVPEAARPGESTSLRYYRWHGSPRVYYSAYDSQSIAAFASAIDKNGADAWCIFDNTALGAATTNALHFAQATGS